MVARDGSIDWLCWPRFDSDACLAALLGDARHGCWSVAPTEPPRQVWHYRRDTPVLETRYVTETGKVCVIDLMPLGTACPAIIPRLIGEAGRVPMTLDLALRFDYCSIPLWLRAQPRIVAGVVAPDLTVLHSPVDVSVRDDRSGADFVVCAGDRLTFVLQYGLSHRTPPSAFDCDAAIAATERSWQEWIGRYNAPTDRPAAVRRSLIALRALTHCETGGMVAAPTAALPEVPRGRETGITATPGFATPPLTSVPFSMPDTRRKPGPGEIGCCAPPAPVKIGEFKT